MGELLAKPASILRLLKAAASDWMEDNALRLSAALAYYSIFSIAPLIMIAMAASGWILGEDAARGLLDDQLKGLLGYQAAHGVQEMVRSASKPESFSAAGIAGIVALLFGASGVFGQLKDALNTIWEVKPKAGQGVVKFIRERLLSFGMVAVIGFLLLVSLTMTTFLSALVKRMGDMLPMSDSVALAIGSVISFCMIAVLFAVIFKVLPDVKIRWSNVWIGAVVTAFLFEIGKFFLGWYLGRESTTSAYGAAGSVVLVLLWVYYASLILLFGAEFTQVYAKARGFQIVPSANAEAVTEEARAQQGLTSTKPPLTDSPSSIFPATEMDVVPLARIEKKRKGDILERNAVSAVLTALGSGFVTGALLRKFSPRLGFLSRH